MSKRKKNSEFGQAWQCTRCELENSSNRSWDRSQVDSCSQLCICRKFGREMYLSLLLIFGSVCCSCASPLVPATMAGTISPGGTEKDDDGCWAGVCHCPPGKFCAPMLSKTYGLCLPCVTGGHRCQPSQWFGENTCCEPMEPW